MTLLLPLLGLSVLTGCTASLPEQQARVNAKLGGQDYATATARMGKPDINQPFPDGVRRLQRFALSHSIHAVTSVSTGYVSGYVGAAPISAVVRSTSYNDDTYTAYCDLSVVTNERSSTIIDITLIGDETECSKALKAVL